MARSDFITLVQLFYVLMVNRSLFSIAELQISTSYRQL